MKTKNTKKSLSDFDLIKASGGAIEIGGSVKGKVSYRDKSQDLTTELEDIIRTETNINVSIIK